MIMDRQFLQARILIVDDQPANLLLLEKMLKLEGYANLTVLSDPRQVEPAYRQQPFDLILLDLNMPHLDGFQVMARLQQIEQHSYLPILVLTAQSDSATKLRALEAGAKDFVSKPFDRVEVMSRIRNMLEVRLLHNQLCDQNSILEEKVRERTRELHDTRLEVIRRLGRAAEYRDNETGLHIIRMSQFSERLGRMVGMSEEEGDMLLNASPMHDIGKIGIPDRILLKPGKLDPDEWETMKTHAAIGAEILSGHHSPLMEMARVIALTHHEKWDGTGYPNALKGEDIPLVGRITALCDVFDALTTERPYKKAWTVEDATAYIRDNRGKHFDPALVDAFDQILPDVLAIREKFSEPE
jgi:putative two-component system response regulator